MDNFQDLDRFLAAFSPEVIGHSAEALTPELTSRIEAFRNGDLGDDEAREFSRELLSNQNAMEHLASLLSD